MVRAICARDAAEASHGSRRSERRGCARRPGTRRCRRGRGHYVGPHRSGGTFPHPSWDVACSSSAISTSDYSSSTRTSLRARRSPEGDTRRSEYIVEDWCCCVWMFFLAWSYHVSLRPIHFPDRTCNLSSPPLS